MSSLNISTWRSDLGITQRWIRWLLAVVTAGTALLAIGFAVAEVPTDLEAFLKGDMRKLVFPDPIKTAALHSEFERLDGTATSLADFSGKYLLVNFWATWCAPCRKEMPALDLLEAEFSSERFQVLAVASGHNPLDDIQEFFLSTEITTLGIYSSPDSALARDFSIIGLPTTVLLDPDGQEIARLTGAADWYSNEARELVRALLQ